MVQNSLELKNISKIFEGTQACKHLNLEIAPGEFFFILGPSGCGKSTLLQMMAGLLSPDEGQIFLDGKDVTQEPAYRRNVNMVFQNYALFPHLNVFDNIAFGPRMKKVPSSQIKERVEKALSLVRLEEFISRFPHQMSGGQQQRVALARALVNEPPVLLLDESLGALDVKLKKQMQLELKALQKKLGTTFIYVTHDQEEALTMGDRIALMNRGIFEQVASPDHIYNKPRTRFVAEFIGDANFFTGASLSGKEASVKLTEKTLLRGLAESLPATANKITLAIRPEKVRISTQSPNRGAHNVISGVIQDKVYRGGSCLYFVTVAPEVVLKVIEQNYLSQVPFNPGQPVTLHWPVDETIVLSE